MIVVVVVECYCFLIYIIVAPPQPGPPHFYFTKVMFFTFSSVSLQSEREAPGCDLCCCRFRRDARPDSTFAKKHFFAECSFVETPGPIYPPWIPLVLPWVSLGLPWVPLGPPCFCRQYHTFDTFGFPGPFWVALGPLWFPLFSFGFPLGPLGSPLGFPWPPKCHFYLKCLMFFF